MRRLISLLFGGLLVLGIGAAVANPSLLLGQLEQPPRDLRIPNTDDEGPRLPNGKLQRDVILKYEHKKNLEDLQEIQRLSEELIKEMETNTEFVLSLASLKKLDRMEKLTKDVRKRVRK